MGRVVITKVDDTAVADFPTVAGVSKDGSIESRGLIAKPDRPVHLWLHQLAPGASITWAKPPVGHAVYVWEGDAAVNGTPVPSKGAALIERGGEATLRAGANGAKIAHYYATGDLAPHQVRAGGHVHVLDEKGLFVARSDIKSDHTIYADAGCPTCELWLHRSANGTARPQKGSHYHTSDEVILVLGGGMQLGNRVMQPGTALAIDANTGYGFGIPEGGLEFLNFRPAGQPAIVYLKKDGSEHPPMDERASLRAIAAKGMADKPLF